MNDHTLKQVTVPDELIVIMSAVKSKEPVPDKGGKKTFHFSQTVPVPAYLIALAIGNLESRKIGPRSHVWAEPEIVEKAEYEFAEVRTIRMNMSGGIFRNVIFRQFSDRYVPEDGGGYLRTVCLENI